MAEKWDGMSERRGDGGLHPEARALFATLIERVDNLREDFKEHKEEDTKRFDKVDERIKPLEHGFWKATGMGVAAAAFVTLAAKYFKLGGS